MSDEIKIEKGVPLPTQRGAVSPLTSLVRALLVGDSFVFKSTGTARSVVYQAAKRCGFKVTCREIGDGQNARVWRTK